ncbi:MAG: hypothetical protein ACFFCW_12480 [Candidatus Hodarchaeota archaeon]
MGYWIVITTRSLPTVLESFAHNFQEYSRKDEVAVLVIGDQKTPAETEEYVAKFANDGFRVEYWDVHAQRSWLERFPELHPKIPYNSDNRRNIGYLIAYERGGECIIAVDDDNYPTEADYLGGHAKVGTSQSWKTVRSSSGWFNICEILEIEEDYIVYPRGYPYAYRWLEGEHHELFENEGRIVVNAGLWLGDPDVDAVTRLHRPVNSVGLKEETLVLDPSTNCPINTQNTAFHRDVLPCFYYVVMGQTIDGLKIDRYGDVWSSYLARKVIDKMDDRVAFGLPLSRHKRHPHDLLKDLGQEYWGMILTNRLVDLLMQIELTATNYEGCYVELSHKLETKVREQEDFSKEIKGYFSKICRNMRIWVDVCRELKP